MKEFKNNTLVIIWSVYLLMLLCVLINFCYFYYALLEFERHQTKSNKTWEEYVDDRIEEKKKKFQLQKDSIDEAKVYF